MPRRPELRHSLDLDFDDDDGELPEPVFYVDGRARSRGPTTLVRRFVHVAGPLWDAARTLPEARKALEAATVSWNITRLPQTERLAAVRAVGRAIGDGTLDLGGFDVFEEMLLRGVRFDDDCAVVEIRFLEFRPGEWHVEIQTVTAEEVRRAASRAAKPRARRRR